MGTQGDLLCTRLSTFQKVKRASRGFQHLPRQRTSGDANSRVNFFTLCVPRLMLCSSDPFFGHWLEAGEGWAAEKALPRGPFWARQETQLTAGSTPPTTPSQAFQQGLRTPSLIPNSIFLNTA